MTKRTQIITATILILAIIIVILFGVALNKRIIYFTGLRPHFSVQALKNPAPSLDRPIHFPAEFTDAAKTIFNTNLAKTKDTLTKDPTNVAAWLDLAIEYRQVGDYAAAVDIWKYISALYPTEGISLHNLGEYYFHTAKDYPTAESYYLKSIKVAPSLTQNYLDLFDMYRYVYKTNTTAAVDIMKQGIPFVSAGGAIGFEVNLGDYYKEKNDITDARLYYTQARDIAKKLGNATIVNQLNTQISQLK